MQSATFVIFFLTVPAAGISTTCSPIGVCFNISYSSPVSSSSSPPSPPLSPAGSRSKLPPPPPNELTSLSAALFK